MTHQGTEQSGVMSAEDFARKWMIEASAHFTWRGDTRVTTITPSKEDVVKALNERDSQIRAERDAEVRELVAALVRIKEMCCHPIPHLDRLESIFYIASTATEKHTKPKDTQ